MEFDTKGGDNPEKKSRERIWREETFMVDADEVMCRPTFSLKEVCLIIQSTIIDFTRSFM
jgi:hypothetical protein